MDSDSRYSGLDKNPNAEKIERAHAINDLLQAIGHSRVNPKDKDYFQALIFKVDGLTSEETLTDLFDQALADGMLSQTQRDELGALLEGRDHLDLSGIDLREHAQVPEDLYGEFDLNLDADQHKEVAGGLDLDLNSQSENTPSEALERGVEGTPYKVSADAVRYLDDLIEKNEGGIRGAVLRSANLFTLDKARSLEEAEGIVKNLLERRFINEAQFRVMNSYLHRDDDFSTISLEDFEAEKPTVVKAEQQKNEEKTFVGALAKQYVKELALKHEPNSDAHKKLAMLAFDLSSVNSLDELEEALKEVPRPEYLSDTECDEIIRLAQGGEPTEKKVAPEVSNEDLEERAFEALEKNDFYTAQQQVLKIKNEELQSTVLGDIARRLINNGKYDKARTFADLIKDEEYRERLFKQIEDEEKNKPISDSSIPEVNNKEPVKTEEAKKREVKNPENKGQKVNPKVFGVMDGIISKIKPGEKAVFRELRDALSSTKDYSEAEAILMDPKYAISIPGPDRKKIMACFQKNGKELKAEDDSTKTIEAESSKKEEVKKVPEESKQEKAEAKNGFIDLALHNVGESNNEESTSEAQTAPEDFGLNQARAEYAAQLIAWKNKNREKKWKITKIFNDLGVERKVPESEKPKELVEAEKAYIEAKKEKSKKIIQNAAHAPVGAPDANGVIDTNFTIDREALTDLAEKEFDALQKQINESRPSLEKSLILKGLEKWSKMPKPTRIAITSSIFFVGGLTVGGMGVAGAATYGGYKAARSAAGMLGAMGTGKAVEKVQDYFNKKSKGKEFEKYTEGLSLDNFAEREKALMEALEKESNKKKRQRVYKAGAMLAAGVGLNLADYSSGSVEPTPQGGISSPPEEATTGNPLSKNLSIPSELKEAYLDGHLDEPQEPIPSDGGLEPAPDQVEYQTEMGENNGELTLADAGPAVESTAGNVEAPQILDVKVDLSEKGFIQDIIDLKAQVRSHFDGQEIPQDIQENLMNKTPIELAKEYGFYDAKNNLSAMGLKGEHLSVDSHGHIVYEHGGKSDVMFDEASGKVKTYTDVGGEKMFKPQVQSEVVGAGAAEPGLSTTPAETTSTFIPDEQPIIPVDEDNPNWAPEKPIVSPNHIELGNGHSLDLQEVGGQKTVLYNTENSRLAIGREEVVGGRKILVLEDRFQEGEINKPLRQAFNQVFEKNVDANLFSAPDQKVINTDFEGGKIYVSHRAIDNPMEVKVFLNGKEIGGGLREDGHIDIKINPELKGGWFMADTVYERAFKVAKNLVKNLK